MKKALYIFLSIAPLGHAMSLHDAWSLHDACRFGDVAEVERILQEDPNQINEKRNGCLPIHRAAYGACTQVVKILLDAKPDLIDQVDERGNTPFNYIFIAALDQQKTEATLQECKEEYNDMDELCNWFANNKKNTTQQFKDTIELFIERGANVDTLNYFECGWQRLDIMPLADYARLLILIKEEKANGK